MIWQPQKIWLPSINTLLRHVPFLPLKILVYLQLGLGGQTLEMETLTGTQKSTYWIIRILELIEYGALNQNQTGEDNLLEIDRSTHACPG